MNTQSSSSPQHIAHVLMSIRRKGGRVWAANGQLRYQAPKGALSAEDIEVLRASKDQLLALLAGGHNSDTEDRRFEAYRQLSRAPLGYSQLVRWHLFEWGEVPSLRQVAVAVRLSGPLDLKALRMSYDEVVRRHDALRTRIAVRDGIPEQVVAPPSYCEIPLQSSRESEVQRLIEDFILVPIDTAVDSLLGIQLLRLQADEHVLIVGMHHLISDEFSTRILLRDLLMAYRQVLQRSEFGLPPIPVQYLHYAAWQRDTEGDLIRRHGAYWSERLACGGRLKFPRDRTASSGDRLGWTMLPIRIEEHLKRRLCEWARRRGTTLALTVLTAYVALVLQWCKATEMVLQYQSNARIDPAIEDTIGFFASVLYLRVELLPGDTFGSLLQRVSAEYCTGYEHADFSYLPAQIPRPAFTRNSLFNWVPQGSALDSSDLTQGAPAGLYCSPVRFAHPLLRHLELDQEPGVLLYETREEVEGGVYFPLSAFSIDMMKTFASSFMAFMEAVATHGDTTVSGVRFVENRGGLKVP